MHKYLCLLLAGAVLVALPACQRESSQENHHQTLPEAEAAFLAGDYEVALKGFLSLAEQGNASAQAFLGAMYVRGEGVPQDYGEALKWLELAADQGHAMAQLSLGLMYDNGDGVPQDYVQAHMWINLSASRSGDDDIIGLRDALANRMTAEQIAEAQRLAREWLERLERLERFEERR